MKKQPRLFAAFIAVCLACGPLPATAQMRVQGRLPTTIGSGISSPYGSVIGAPTLNAGSLFNALTPGIGLNGSLAAPSVTPSPLVSVVPAALTVVTAAFPRQSEAAFPGLMARSQAAAPAAPAAALASLASALPAEGAVSRKEDADGLPVQRRFYDGSAPMVKPLVEAWTVNGRSYESTAQLVRELPRLDAPLPAAYTFGHHLAVADRERNANAAIGGFSGASFAAAGAVLLMLMVSAVGDFIGILLGILPGGGPSLLAPFILGMIGSAAAVGAVIGAVSGRDKEAGLLREQITGTLVRQDDKLLFLPEGGQGAAVDLAAFAKAVLPTGAAAARPVSVKKALLRGLGAGFALAVGHIIPILNAFVFFFGGLGTGSMIGSKLTERNNVMGGLLGAALGLAVPIGFIAMAAAGSGAAFIAWFAAMVLGGAALGLLLRIPLARAKAWQETFAPADQWWTKAWR